MPKLINDEMILVTPEIKKVIRRSGYAEVAKVIGKTTSYVRSLASKGKKKIRKSDIDKINTAISDGDL